MQSFSQDCFVFKRNKRVSEIYIFSFEFFNIVLNIFSIRSNNRTVVVVVSTIYFFVFIWNARIKDEFNTFLYKPAYMTMSKLSRITF